MLDIPTFDQRHGGNVLYKALAHPLAAEAAAALYRCLGEYGPVAVVDPTGFAAALFVMNPDLPALEGIYVQDVAEVGMLRAGHVTRKLTDLYDAKVRAAADALYADGEVGALRVHASRGGRGHRLAIRLLARSVPELASLRLPPIVASFGDYRYGFVLVCGPGGSGKTTTVASLLQRANESSARHVVTLEAPIEHVLPWGTSVVTQYEVGRDVASYAHGVRGALRADPDLIFIGELCDADAAAACLQAAESGHLVLGALDAPPEVPLALNRLVGLFPVEEQQRARNRLAENLRAVLALRLVPARDGSGMRPAAEILLTNDAVRRMLRDGANHLIRGQISANRKSGMQTLEAHLADLVGAGEVDLDVARALALYPEDIREPQFAGRERS